MTVYDLETGKSDGYLGHWEGRNLSPTGTGEAKVECHSCRDKDREIALLRAILDGKRTMRLVP